MALSARQWRAKGPMNKSEALEWVRLPDVALWFGEAPGSAHEETGWVWIGYRNAPLRLQGPKEKYLKLTQSRVPRLRDQPHGERGASDAHGRRGPEGRNSSRGSDVCMWSRK